MGKRGRKPQPAEVIELKGNTSKAPPRHQAVADIPGPIVCPKWLTVARGKNVWLQKVVRYEARGEDISRCEDTLAQYCALEQDIVNM